MSSLSKIKNNLFHRIGDSYAHLIDGGHFLGRNAFGDLWMKKPAANIRKPEKAESYVVSLALPGYKKEDIEVAIEKEVLYVKASPKQKPKAKTEKLIHTEFETQQQERTFQLPPNVNSDKIEADYKDGILTIRVPYHTTAKTAKPQFVKVK
jgi:HSP20 family protein